MLIMQFLPEICILLGALGALFSSRISRAYGWAMVSVIAAALSCYGIDQGAFTALSDWQGGGFSALMKLMILLGAGQWLVYTRLGLSQDKSVVPEYYALWLFSLLGLMGLCGARSFLLMYLSLELMSLPLYAMMALRRSQDNSIEAALKYFILGSLSSAFILFGMAWWYGLTHTLIPTDMLQWVGGDAMFSVSMLFIVLGMAFKFGWVPAHHWVPDIYQGASSDVVAWIATVPKLGLFMLLYALIQPVTLEHSVVHTMLMLMGGGSIVLGMIMAIQQTHLFRLLGYASIVQMGFLALALSSGDPQAWTVALFYLVIYVLSLLTLFGSLMLLSHDGFDVRWLKDLNGLYQAAPGWAFLILILLLSMAGIPPMIGFVSKLLVMKSWIDMGHWPLAAAILVLSTLSVAYYLKVLKHVFFEKNQNPWIIEKRVCARAMVMLSVFFLLVMSAVPAMIYPFIGSLWSL